MTATNIPPIINNSLYTNSICSVNASSIKKVSAVNLLIILPAGLEMKNSYFAFATDFIIALKRLNDPRFVYNRNVRVRIYTNMMLKIVRRTTWLYMPFVSLANAICK